MENKSDTCPICGNIMPVDSYLFYPENISIYLNKLVDNEIDNIIDKYFSDIYKKRYKNKKIFKRKKIQ